ncbi:hypothetical protein QZH46_19130 [Pseudomonas corrugata]
MLTGLSVQRYKDASSGATLPDGVADLQALADHLERAELDETALDVFRLLPEDNRPKEKELEQMGYHPMTDFLPAPQPARKLWSVKSGFATYAPLEGFYKVNAVQPSQSHGVSEIGYDKYACFVTTFKLPDGCTTQATYDYRSLQPLRIVDPNGNVQEGLFDAFGQVLATSFMVTNTTPAWASNRSRSSNSLRSSVWQKWSARQRTLCRVQRRPAITRPSVGWVTYRRQHWRTPTGGPVAWPRVICFPAGISARRPAPGCRLFQRFRSMS